MTHVYRNSKLGDSLVEALAEMVDSHKISGHLASEVLEKFDEAMADALERKVSAKANFRSKLQVYRYIDNVWTFVMADTTLRLAPFLTTGKKDEEEVTVEGPLKMVLVDAKITPAGQEAAGKGKGKAGAKPAAAGKAGGKAAAAAAAAVAAPQK